MRDVANRCNVSISTVSLVLSGDERIPEDTARQVLQAVKAMQYRPSVVARNLARRASRTIGVILPESAFTKNKAFYYQALQGIHSQTQPAGFKIVVEAANKVFLTRRYYLRILKEQSADGMIYLASSLNDTFLKDMEKEAYPFVLAGAYADGVNLPMFHTDDVAGAKMAVKHLISLGHKKIGHISGSMDVSTGRDREKGYRAAMTEAKLSISQGWVSSGEFEMGLAEQKVQDLVRAGVSAIFIANDSMAYGALRGLRKLGLNVPKDMAIVAMDDLEMSSWVDPALTTVRTDIRQIGELAAQYVIGRIQSTGAVKSAQKTVPVPQLIVRSSCGAKK